jgi:putative nucleotidyltransferase with HDIG domain
MLETGHTDLDADEVYRRMPALNLIDDVDLREQTAELTASAPRYYWTVPASTSGFHNPLCRGARGLWAHTLMVSTVLERLADSYVEQGLLTWGDIDMARSAAILHDQRKNGDPESPANSSVSDHDLQMAQVASLQGLPSGVVEAIRSHMGAWYDGPEPSSPLEDLVHNADMVASTATITPKAPAPLPEELEEIGVEEANL